MKRAFDIILVIILLIIFAIPMLLIAIAVRLTSEGPVIYWSHRFGYNNAIFSMPKFRSMKLNTPITESHLLTNSEDFLTPVGRFIRRTSLDELPQLFSILKGDMSFVGYRPVLTYNEHLNKLRTKYKIYQMMPGLTGWAQVNGRDTLPTTEKIELEVEYMKNYSLWFDLKILLMTLLKVLKKENVLH